MMNKTMQMTKTKTGSGYVRESSEDQDKGFSPENQKRMIEEYAKRNGIVITAWYKDLITGTNAAKRDDFQRMINDAKQKRFDVVLTYHTSRFARNIKEAKHYKNLLREDYGVNVISVTQNFGDDWNNPSSYLNETINEVFDEYYSKQLSFWVKNSLMEKRRQGKQNGNPPLGYYKRQVGYDDIKERPIYDPKWRVHKKEAAMVNKIFQLYASGTYSMASIAKKLNQEGHKTKNRQLFTYSSIKCVLSNQTYLGYVYSARRGYPTIKNAAHPAIVDEKLFNKVQEILVERNHAFGRPIAQHRFYLLQGLVYCYHCKRFIKGKEDKPNAKLIPKMFCETRFRKHAGGAKSEHYIYCCKLNRENLGCNQQDVETNIVDSQVIGLMDGFNFSAAVINKTLEKLKAMFGEAQAANSNKKIIDGLKSKKKKITWVYENTDQYTEAEYLQKIQEIDLKLAKHDKFGLVNNDTKIKTAECIKQTQEFLVNFKKEWYNYEKTEQRAWIQMSVKRIWVKDKQVVALEPKEEFKPLFSLQREVIAQAPLAAPQKDPINIGSFCLRGKGTATPSKI